jgi:hypothetical protein
MRGMQKTGCRIGGKQNGVAMVAEAVIGVERCERL